MDSDEKSKFLAMMNHELKTPLVSIQGFAELLKDPDMGNLNEDQKNAVEEIFKNSIILNDIITNMIDIQKIETNMLNFLIENVNVSEYMEKTYNTLQPLMEKKNIEFVNSTTVNSKVLADVTVLDEIFTKLVKNSISFVGENGKIEIGVKDNEKDVTFFVKDNGKGISKEKQNQLFTKFYQVDNSMTREHGGTGLSLTVCKGFIEEMKGKIWCESDEGNGATFFFTIPKA